MKTIRIHSIHIEEWQKARNTIDHVDTVPVTLGDEAILQTVELTFRGLVNSEVYTDYFKTFMFEFKVLANNDTVGNIQECINTVLDNFKSKGLLFSELISMCGIIYNNSIKVEEDT